MNASFEQLDLDFRGPVGGYDLWRADREEALCQIARVWGLPIGQHVRLKRLNIDGEFVGPLRVAVMPPTIDRRLSLALQVGRTFFESTEIETCVVMDP